MGKFLPQWNDNKRFLEDQLKVERLYNKETDTEHVLLTGLLMDGKKYREDQRDGCMYVPATQEEADLQFLKLSYATAEELDELISLYDMRIADMTEFIDSHDWDGDAWQPDVPTIYTTPHYIPQYNDTHLFLIDQLELFEAGLKYHVERRNWAKAEYKRTPMSILQEEVEAQTKIISYYTQRIRDIKDYIYPPIHN